MVRVLVCVALVGGLLIPALVRSARADAPAIRPVSGTLIVARSTGQQARILWDATPYVTQLVSDGLTDQRGVRALEATALRALADKSKNLTVAKLSLEVTYAKTGAVSPVYGSATFAGFEPLMTIAVDRAALARHVDEWSGALANGTIPAGVTVTVTGSLPPAR